MRRRCVQKERRSLALSNIFLPPGAVTDSKPQIRGFKDSTGPHAAKPGTITSIMTQVLKHIIFLSLAAIPSKQPPTFNNGTR